MKQKKIMVVVAILIIILAAIGLVATLFLNEFNIGLSKINKIDKKYSYSIKDYPSNFTKIEESPLTVSDITFMSNEIKGVGKESKEEALLKYIEFRMNLLEAEMNYKLAMEIGPKGNVNDGFGCKDKPLVISAASYRNQSAQSGYKAVKSLREFFEIHGEKAELTEIPKSLPLFLEVSFQGIEKRSNSTIEFINRVCPDK